MFKISSPHNDKVRLVNQLQRKRKSREELQQFVCEGQQEFGHALSHGFIPEMVFVCPDVDAGVIAFAKAAIEKQSNSDASHLLIEVTSQVYEKMAYRSGTEGLIAVLRSKSLSVSDLQLSPEPLILIAERPEKPGNLGALLRTVDAVGADALIIADPATDIYNPNVIRSSVGTVFTVPVATGSSAEVQDFLASKQIPWYAAALQNSTDYLDQDYSTATAIVVGTESTGLTKTWRSKAQATIRIPMNGAVDSLNVSVSAAVLLYECARQRRSPIN